MKRYFTLITSICSYELPIFMRKMPMTLSLICLSSRNTGMLQNPNRSGPIGKNISSWDGMVQWIRIAFKVVDHWLLWWPWCELRLRRLGDRHCPITRIFAPQQSHFILNSQYWANRLKPQSLYQHRLNYTTKAYTLLSSMSPSMTNETKRK